MDDVLTLTERVAEPGDLIEVEPCFELTDAATMYLAVHSLDAAPMDEVYG
jgi:hypothetical protein